MILLIIIILVLLFLQRYIYLQTVSSYQMLPSKLPTENVVVSMTTTPTRINNMEHTINSILTQTVRIKEIQIYLPLETLSGKSYEKPEWLERLYPLVKIYRVERDYGPATKIIPAVLRCSDEDQKIIYIDDDTIYFSGLIKTLLDMSLEQPDRAIGMSGDKNKVLHGWGGVLVKPRFFNKETIEDIPPELIFMDDHYLSLHLAKNGIKKDCVVLGINPLKFLGYFSCPNWKELKGFFFKSSDGLSSNVNKSDRYAKGIKYFNEQMKGC